MMHETSGKLSPVRSLHHSTNLMPVRHVPLREIAQVRGQVTAAAMDQGKVCVCLRPLRLRPQGENVVDLPVYAIDRPTAERAYLRLPVCPVAHCAGHASGADRVLYRVSEIAGDQG